MICVFFLVFFCFLRMRGCPNNDARGHRETQIVREAQRGKNSPISAS